MCATRSEEIFSRCTSLPANLKEAVWKSMEHVLKMCGFVFRATSTTIASRCSIHRRIYLCNSIWLWERSFSVWHCGNQQHNTQLFSALFGGFIFIHFVPNLPSKKCSTASILLGICDRMNERDRERTFWCQYHMLMLKLIFFIFISSIFSHFSLPNTHTLTHSNTHFTKFSYATTNAPKRNWRGKMLMAGKNGMYLIQWKIPGDLFFFFFVRAFFGVFVWCAVQFGLVSAAFCSIKSFSYFMDATGNGAERHSLRNVVFDGRW